MLGQPGRGHQGSRILLEITRARQPLEPTADGGQRPRGRGFGEAAVVKRAQVGADVSVLDAVDRLFGAEPAGDEGGEVAQFTIVGAQGVRR